VRILLQQFAVERHLGERDSIAFAFRPVAKPVEDDERERPLWHSQNIASLNLLDAAAALNETAGRPLASRASLVLMR
jgi:hypothetical protein